MNSDDTKFHAWKVKLTATSRSLSGKYPKMRPSGVSGIMVWTVFVMYHVLKPVMPQKKRAEAHAIWKANKSAR
jgi:hypothetical protein